MPGLYENLSTKSIRSDETVVPDSNIAFFTSRPTWRNTGKDAVWDESGNSTSSDNLLLFDRVLEIDCARTISVGKGSGGTGGAGSLFAGEGVRGPFLDEPAGDFVSDSSTSVSTASSTGVKFDETAIERRLGELDIVRSRVRPFPAILLNW